jgi:hypothetical protein
MSGNTIYNFRCWKCKQDWSTIHPPYHIYAAYPDIELVDFGLIFCANCVDLGLEHFRSMHVVPDTHPCFWALRYDQ